MRKQWRFTVWCAQCHECHPGVTPLEAQMFVDTHQHRHVLKVAPDWLLDSMVLTEAERILKGNCTNEA